MEFWKQDVDFKIQIQRDTKELHWNPRSGLPEPTKEIEDCQFETIKLQQQRRGCLKQSLEKSKNNNDKTELSRPKVF